MCCGGDESRREEQLEKLTGDHETKHPRPGLKKRRYCRDVIFALLFVVFWAGLLAIAYYAVMTGDPDRLVYGDDYQGNICGKDNRNNEQIKAGLARAGDTPRDHRDNPNQYYLFAISTDAFAPNAPRICVSQCPRVTTLSLNQLQCLYPYQTNATLQDVHQGRCFFSYASYPVLNRCVPEIVVNTTSTAAKALELRDMAEQVVASVYQSGTAIGLSLIGAFVLGLVWIILMRFFAGVTVWFTIWASVLSVLALAVMLYLGADDLQRAWAARPFAEQLTNEETNFLILRYTSYALAIIAGIAILIIIFNGRNIALTVTLCEEAGKALVDMPFLIGFPLIPFAIIACLTVYFAYIGLYLATSADLQYSDTGVYEGLSYSNTLRGFGVAHLLGYLWTCNFVLALHQTTVAGSIGDWYYSYQGKQLRPCVVTRSFFRALFWNFGSLAFGSFILALVELVRVILAFIHARLKAHKGARLAEACLRCMHCCLACFQRFIEFLNKHAYILIALYGYDFCTSARRGFGVMITNPIQVGTIHGITELIMFLGKLFVTCTVTAGAYVYLKVYDVTRMWYVPLILIALAAFFLSSCFFLIYDTAVSTLLFCFLEDSQRNSADDRHCSKALESFVSQAGGLSCCCCC